MSSEFGAQFGAHFENVGLGTQFGAHFENVLAEADGVAPALVARIRRELLDS